MIRTQIYITQKEQQALSQLTKSTGKNQSELIRDAIDRFCLAQLKENRINLLRSARGIWENRTDFADFESFRKEFDRDFDEKE